ncbi:MAG: hypothetical protein ACTHKA_07915 [Anaerocolumna jejuensis]
MEKVRKAAENVFGITDKLQIGVCWAFISLGIFMVSGLNGSICVKSTGKAKKVLVLAFIIVYNVWD